MNLRHNLIFVCNKHRMERIAIAYLILEFINTMNMFLLQQLVRNIYCYNAQTEYFTTKFKFVHYQHQQPFLSLYRMQVPQQFYVLSQVVRCFRAFAQQATEKF